MQVELGCQPNCCRKDQFSAAARWCYDICSFHFSGKRGGLPRRGIEIQMHREGLVRSRHLQKPTVRYKMKYPAPLWQSKK